MPLPTYDTLALELDDRVARVSLNRPDKANSMSAAMWSELEACFRWLDAEPGVRAVVLRGEGRHFCSGIDLEMLAQLDDPQLEAARRAERRRDMILRLQRNLTAIEECRKPVLAAIHSTCIGGGIDLTCCCDMRFCSADAWFSIKEIEIGMVADVGTLQRLPRLVGDGITRELAYTGRRFEAAEARAIGFVNRVFDDRDSLLAGVEELARTIARRSPLAIRGTKELLLYGRDHSVADGLRYIANWNAGMLSADDLMTTIGVGGQPDRVDYED